MTSPHATTDPVLSYDRPAMAAPGGPWAKLVRVLAFVGIGVALARGVQAYDGVLWGIELRSSMFGPAGDGYRIYVISGILYGLASAGLLACAIGCLCARGWARHAIILNEFAAIIVITLSALSALVDRQLSEAPFTPFGVARSMAWMMIELAYPILAIAIVRSPGARGAFVFVDEDATDEQGEADETGERQITP